MSLLLIVAIAVASAIATLLSAEPFGSGIAAIAAPAFLVYIACKTTTRVSTFLVFVFQVPLWLWIEYWVKEVTIAGWIGIGLYMSIWAPLFVVILRRVVQTKRISGFSIVLSAPIIWVGLECLRGIVVFDGYPWYLTGTGIVDWPVAQIAALGSVWLVSFGVVAWAAALARCREPRPITWALLVLFAIASTLYGGWREKKIITRLPLALVQTNVPQSNKIAWSFDQQEQDISEAIRLTRLATLGTNEVKPSLIIWPETMLPGSGFELSGVAFEPYTANAKSLWIFPEKVRSLARELNIPLLIGSHTWVGLSIEDNYEEWVVIKPSKEFNSSVLVRPDGTTLRYDKSFLTPFGERIPYVSFFPAIEEWIRDSVGAPMLFSLDAGEEQKRFAVSGIRGEENVEVRIATPICFEDTVPFVVRNLVWEDNQRKTDLLINMSNDGWFGDADSARLQHIREARMRCIENRTPMVRVANTGLSCVIDDYGRVVSTAKHEGSNAMRKTAILFASPSMGTIKPFSRFVGDSVAWTCLFGCILLTVFTYTLRSSISHEKTHE